MHVCELIQFLQDLWTQTIKVHCVITWVQTAFHKLVFVYFA